MAYDSFVFVYIQSGGPNGPPLLFCVAEINIAPSDQNLSFRVTVLRIRA